MFPSLVSIVVYTLGFPLFLFWLLRFGDRKDLLKEDQLLRAMELGDSLGGNPRAYHIRVRYHKMYYYYKPGKTYWMLVILARKVGIAFCALIFRTNPGFMLASVVLILFIAFSLQTRHSPYMSASQRQIVLAEHSIKAEVRVFFLSGVLGHVWNMVLNFWFFWFSFFFPLIFFVGFFAFVFFPFPLVSGFFNRPEIPHIFTFATTLKPLKRPRNRAKEGKVVAQNND
jgi:hypothetical protein